MELSPEKIQQFQTKILTWYEKNRRDLPWRRTRDPYKILVSEVMLQQTQVSRVIPKYEAWLRAFPTVEVLAKASVSDVLTYWMGLGYNRRAMYLQKASKALVSEYSENSASQKIRKSESQRIRITELSESSGKIRWPQTEKELMKLPGIGQYTARALLSFAFGKDVAVVDTNVKKVILVEVLKETKGTNETQGTKEIEEIADMLLPKTKIIRLRSGKIVASTSYEWNQALMDYASTVLKNEKIPVPKQSKYVGSNRYYRAKILKLLLKEKKIPLRKLGPKLREDFSEELIDWLDRIVFSLEKDSLVTRGKNALTIRH